MDPFDTIDQVHLPKFNIVTTSVLKQLPPLASQETQLDEDGARSSLQNAENLEVEQFERDIEFQLCCVGFVVGFGNVLRFPYIVLENGGVSFFVPYVITSLLVVFPLLVLEVSWGQLIRTRLDHKFSALHPGLWGIGLAMLWMNVLMLPYYTTLFPYCLSFLLAGLSDPLPWVGEEADQSLWNKTHFSEEVLHRSDSITSSAEIVPKLLYLLFFTYGFLYFAMWKGIKSSSQFAYATVTFPYFIMAVLLIKGVSLPGSEAGLKRLLRPDWTSLLDLSIWKTALVYNIYSMGLTFGPYLYYASARRPTADILRPCFQLPLIDAISSIFGSLTIFSFIGYVASELNVDVGSISSGGWDLAFTAYPGLIATLDLPNLWVLLFFSMLLLLGIDSIFSHYIYVISYTWDFFPRLRRVLKKEQFVLIIIICMMAMGLPFVTTNGWWWFNLFNTYAVGDSLMFVLAAESYAIAIYFGIDRVEALMMQQTRETFPVWMKYCIKLFSIPMVTILFLFGIYDELNHVKLEPAWTQHLGRCLLAMPVVLVVGGFIFPRKSTSIWRLIEKQYGSEMKNRTQQKSN